MSLQDIFSLCFSFLALVVACVSLYMQYMVEGPKIDILNANDVQRSVPRQYSGLPKNIQDNFPHYLDAEPGYALVKMVFGNSGDRAGIVTIQNMDFKKGLASKLIKASYYSYTLVPAYDIVEKEILLRNIPLGRGYQPDEIELEITIEHGGYHPRSSKYLSSGVIQKILKVSLVPSNENPPPMEVVENPFYN